MSLQERTLVVKNFDPEKTTSAILKELCLQGGPVRNVVIKPDHAFVEYEDIESVGYSKALLDGVTLYGKNLIMEPKTKTPTYFKYTQLLNDYIKFDKHQRQQSQQMMAYCNQQQSQITAQYLPQTQMQPNGLYLVQEPNPNIFNQGFCIPQSQSFSLPSQPPSTSLPRRNDNIRRSRSFNNNYHHSNHHQNSHHHNNQHNYQRPFNKGDWERRR